jgi:DNA-binding beta-propeller fold protein YncE
MGGIRTTLLAVLATLIVLTAPVAGVSAARQSSPSAASIPFGVPVGVAVGPTGAVYVSDDCRRQVDQLSPDGVVTRIFSEGITSRQDRRGDYQGLALNPQGDLFVASAGVGQIVHFLPTESATPAGGLSLVDGLQSPVGLAVDRLGNLYVAEAQARDVRKIDPQGKTVATWYIGTVRTNRLIEPRGIALDRAGNVYVTDAQTSYIYKLSPSGKLLARWGGIGTAPGRFDEPTGIALDAQGNMYIPDRDNNRVQKLSARGRPLGHWGRFGHGNRQFAGPNGIALDNAGNIYVADTNNRRIEKLGPHGAFLASWPSRPPISLSTARLSPRSVSAAPAGRLRLCPLSGG